MINWEATFIQPYAQALSQGTVGNAREHARAITNYYINSIITGAPQGIPPTLPSGIPPVFPPVPVGPGTFYNTYPSRRKIFEDTIYIYFQGKALLQGKANIQDLVASYKRLQRRAKQIANEIKTLQSSIKTLEENIAQLGPQLAEFWKDLKQLIEDKKNELRNILDGTDNNNFRDLASAEFKELFRREIDLYNSVINFKITANPVDYSTLVNIIQTATSLYSELNTIVNVGDVNKIQTNFRKYLIKKLIATIQSIINLAQGFINPANILIELQDTVALARYVKYNKTYLLVRKYVTQSKYYQLQKLRLDALINDKKRKYKHIVDTKIKQLKAEIKKRIEEYKSTSKSYKWFVSKSAVFKQKKNTVKKHKKQIQAKKQKIKKLRLIANELKSIQQDFDTIVATIKREYIKIVNDINKLQNAVQNAPIAAQEAIQQLDMLKTMTAEQRVNLGVELFGQATNLAIILTDTTTLNNALKSTLKAKLNEVNSSYDIIIDKLATIIVRVQTLNKLLEINANEPNSIIFDKEVLRLQQQEATRINEIVQARRIGSKSTFVGVFKIVNDIEYLVGLISPKLQQKIDVELVRIKKDIKQTIEENKFIKEIAKVNASITRVFNNKTKIEAETREREEKIKRAKKYAQEAKLISKMVTAGVQLSENVAKNKFLITENQQPLTTFITSYYGYQKVSEKLTPTAADSEKAKQLKQLDDLKNYELFATVLIELFRDLASGEFVTDMQQLIDSYKSDDRKHIELTAFVDAFKTTKPTVDSIVTMLSNVGMEMLLNIANIAALQQIESKYTRRVLQVISQYEQTFNKRNNQQPNTTLQRFFKDVRVGGSVIVTLLKYFKKYVKDPMDKFIKDWTKARLKKIKDEQLIKRKKLIQAKKEFTDKLKDKLVNIDAKAMGVMFGLAARLFWTGATWTNPVGTTFTVFTIGPFKPIKGLPKDGAAGIAREIGNSFKLQLLPMTGLATPLPANAIPPFPFVGYN